ncbi:RNA polymerase-binding protein DksA [Hyphobacterium sp. HN65]|uniref:RNA polymerase-binding transcription factor DksA n=1 Tax=Hyphobacterium lacteum TaxID=3116575 RepID=A0ABU7LQJ9_9PROT|nr:RNA polymerase-binding protein DksA [Hyphobacterium sp. HN65]MEE2526193.1 RNA polymerase-binding protein DksA [Hyphobacterium sp. HN65]
MAKKTDASSSSIELPAGYKPTTKEPFMNERQQEYFRRKLEAWKEEIIRESKSTIETLQSDVGTQPDIADRASAETDRSLELRARDRQRKLISKIDSALRRIDEGTYGYCEETGEPISLKRLDARPVATLSLEAQERHERSERVHRDD